MTLLKILVFSCLVGAIWCENWKFPPGFKFGAASSAYQVEGAWNASDKAENICDRWAHANPAYNSDNGDVACDSYHLWKDDVDIISDLGLHFYRFSISWSRLLPTGLSNKISEAGKQYYNRLINALLERGIEPVITLYHWDLPQRLQDLGGWTNPMIADWFADYARVVYSLYGDRVKTWITINEPNLMCDGSYNMGMLAPGIQDPEFGNYICGKNVLVAHAKAWRVYDEEFKAKFKGGVAIANHYMWFEPASKDDEEVAEIAKELNIGLHTHAIYSKEGGWPKILEHYIKEKSLNEGYARSRLPAFTPEEIQLVKGTHDFIAFNFYTARLVRRAREGEAVGDWPMLGSPDFNFVLEKSPNWTEGSNAIEWTSVYPEGLRRLLSWLKNRYGNHSIFITENGYGTTVRELNDVNRVNYIKGHLEQILLAIKQDGVDVTGYTVWSLMDSLEWSDGYKSKFGLYDVDFADPKRRRTPRASAQYYANVIKSHSLNVSSDSYNEIRDEL